METALMQDSRNVMNWVGWSTKAEKAVRGLGISYTGGGSSDVVSTTCVNTSFASPFGAGEGVALVVLIYGRGKRAARFCTAEVAFENPPWVVGACTTTTASFFGRKLPV